jgi:hypothetical protein
VNAAKRIILLLWLLVTGLANVSALTPGTLENRVWEKSATALETRQAEPLQTLELHQENGVAAYDLASESLLAAESGALRWGPLNGPGPLGGDVAATFRGGSYTELSTSEATTLYRVYGGNAGELGSYWSRTAPAGPLQSTMDSALNPAWGNTAQSVSTIRVPTGTTIYDGFAAPQGGLMGGGSQVYIPKVNPSWVVHP